MVVSHTCGRGHKPPCLSQGCLHHCIAVTFFSCWPFLTACAPCLSLSLSTWARCTQLASLYLSPCLTEDPHPWTLCLLGRCDAAVQITSQPPALQNASRGWAARSWSTLSALSEMSIICFICLPELQWTSLPVWPVAQVLQHVKKPPLSWDLLWHIFSDEQQASLNTKLKECQMGWVIFIPLSNPCFWTAGARPLKSWSWHNPGICF